MNGMAFRPLAAGLIAAFALPAFADDIELFAAPSIDDGTTPNVLFVLDNAANFSSNVTTLRCSISPTGEVITDGSGLFPTFLDRTAAAVEQCALYSALKALETGEDRPAFNIGVMGFNATNIKSYDPQTDTISTTACPGNTGGCLLMPLTPFNDTTKPRILNWIRDWSASASDGVVITSNNQANGAAMQESWAYYSGKTGISGRDYASVQPTSSICGTGSYTIFVGNAYRNNATPGDQTNEANSPKKALEGTMPVAGKNADPNASDAERSLFSGSISTVCGTASLPAANRYEGEGAYALNWARYMRGQGITTYSIGVLGPTCNADYAAHLTKLGQDDVGGGKFFGTNNYEELTIAIGSALSEILSTNSAFASVSLPVSVNTQGTYLNQVYIGMFRPDQDFFPRWPGNLKQYRMAIVDGQLQLVDASTPPASAISGSGTGFIAECARSYWTPTDADTYWGTTFESANCSPFSAASNTPDGNVVEKGAQAYMLRASDPGARNMLTCDADCSDLDDFDDGNDAITSAALGVTTDDERTALINWARGLNNKGDELLVGATAMRPSVHGDVVHSRPVALNFATGVDADTDRETVVFYGGNDGVLRAINGNRDGGLSIGTAPNQVAPGNELWSFVAPESYGMFKRLYDNTIPVHFRGTGAASAQPKSYGFDGPVTAYRDTSNTWIFASMRRGGRMLYALDVTTPTTPSLKWRVGCPQNFALDGTVDDTGCTTGMSGIGQTWSAPATLSATGYTGPLLIFGGGYDTCEDFDDGTANHECTGSSKGKSIYVLDADDGTVQRTFATERGVVGEIRVVTDPVTGHALYAYAADLGGNVYRITIGSAAPAAWTMTRIAALGCDDGGTCDANRKFMFAPDVVNEFGTYIVLLGSGDREKPLNNYDASNGVTNYFFMLKDRPNDAGWLTDECGSEDFLCLESLQAIDEDTPTSEQLANTKGWYLSLESTEQVVTSAITVFGTTTFSTHMPYVPPAAILTAADCKPSLGTAKVYNVRYLNAESANGTDLRYQLVDGGGLPPSPVAGRVTLDDGTTVPFLIGGSPGSPLDPGVPPESSSTVTQPKVRVYRYIQQ